MQVTLIRAPFHVHAQLHHPTRRVGRAKKCVRGDGADRAARRGALGGGIFGGFGGFGGKGANKARAEKAEVLRLAEEQRRGVGHTKSDRDAMEAAIDALVDAAGGPGGGSSSVGAATSSKRLTANWRLAWSSEQETLFLLEKFPGGKGDNDLTQAYQSIDVDEETLGNAVVFGNGNRFVVGRGFTAAHLWDVGNVPT